MVPHSHGLLACLLAVPPLPTGDRRPARAKQTAPVPLRHREYRMPQSGVGSISNYTKFEQVGEGTYGYVFRAVDRRTNATVALKRMIIHKEHLGFPLCAVREIKFLRSLHHKVTCWGGACVRVCALPVRAHIVLR